MFQPFPSNTAGEGARARAVAVLRYTKKRTWQAGRRRAAERRGAAFGQAAAAGAPRALPTPQQEKQKEKNSKSRVAISNLKFGKCLNEFDDFFEF